MIKIYKKTIKSPGLKLLSKFEPDSWILVENPTRVELKRLRDEFSLKEGLLEDAVDPNEVPRMEIEGKITYIFARVPIEDEEGEIFTSPLLVAIAPKFLVTVSKKHLPFFEKFLRGEIEFYTTQKAKLFLQIFSEINSTYNKSLNDIRKRVRGISVHLEKITNQDIIQFVALESILNDFISSLIPTNNIFQHLLWGKTIKLYKEDEELVGDLLLSNEQLIEASKNNLKTIVNIREACSTIMTNNLNRVMKLLTALTILMSVPTIIASFYGMNMALPLAKLSSAFFIVTGLTIVITLILLIIFIKRRWL